MLFTKFEGKMFDILCYLIAPSLSFGFSDSKGNGLIIGWGTHFTQKVGEVFMLHIWQQKEFIRAKYSVYDFPDKVP